MAGFDKVVSGANSIAITGTATGGNSLGVLGKGEAVGVRGESTSWHAVIGLNSGTQGAGVYGHSAGTGVIGESETWMGVYGKSDSTTGGAGIMGEAVGPGVLGKSQTWMGVYGETQSTTGGAGVWGEHKANGTGVVGKSSGGIGVWGTSESNEGVHAETHSTGTAAIAAYNLNAAGTGAAIFAKKEGAVGHAGFFDGDVHVTGAISVDKDVVLTNADCAEDFDVADPGVAEPGSVMVLTDDSRVTECTCAYDKRVAGIVSGAGSYRPAIVLDRTTPDARRKPIALVGKVYCRVDADYGAIAVGDLLTTSPTTGHAMKAADSAKAFGAVIGKALQALSTGRSLISVLVALQ
jgi:hypothetical protein